MYIIMVDNDAISLSTHNNHIGLKAEQNNV
jgi:hypothetical protein